MADIDYIELSAPFELVRRMEDVLNYAGCAAIFKQAADKKSWKITFQPFTGPDLDELKQILQPLNLRDDEKNSFRVYGPQGVALKV